MKSLTTLLIVAVLTLSCDCVKKTADAEKSVQVSNEYEIIHQQAYGGKEQAVNQVFKSAAEFEKSLQGGAITWDVKDKLQKIDFDKKMVAILHMGTRNTGGYSIGVSDVFVSGNTTYVTVKETSPQLHENVTMALTNPYCIVVLERNDNVVFRK